MSNDVRRTVCPEGSVRREVRRWRLQRWGLLLVIVLAACAGSTYSLEFDQFAAQQALAQAGPTSAATPLALPTDTPTPNISPTSVPTPTPTNVPVIATDTALATATGGAVATDTGVPSPTATPPVPTMTPSPPPVIALPPILTQADPPGTLTTQIVGVGGGNALTPDGRVALAFQPGVLGGDATIAIQSAQPTDPWPPMLPHPIINAWRFTATDATGATISSFAQPVFIYVRESAGEMAGRNPSTLALWTLDETTNQWQPVRWASSDAANRTLVAALPHFSIYGLTADPTIDQAPFSDGAAMDMHAGAGTLAIPIEVPPGPGGLAPDLSLNYDSGRVNNMKSGMALGSWAGIGWDLSPGAIKGQLTIPQFDTAYEVSLDIKGIGGRIAAPGAGGYWHLENENFISIQLLRADGITPGDAVYCVGFPCEWRVIDKKGTSYYFGASDNERRYTANSGVDGPPGYYQWDLSRITDASGNAITYSYTQVPAPSGGQMDAYVSRIDWGGHNHVEFGVDLTTDPDYVDVGYRDGNSAIIPIRRDTPHNVPGRCYPSTAWQAPPVVETRKLKSISVQIDNTEIKRYDFTYNPMTDFQWAYAGAPGAWVETPILNDCPIKGRAGQMTLQKVVEKGANGALFRTMTFTYGATDALTFLPPAFTTPPATQETFTWPLLTKWDNGLGGSVTLGYQAVSPSPNLWSTTTGWLWDSFQYCWSLNVATHRIVSYGAGQPDVDTAYSYDGTTGPDRDFAPAPTQYSRPNAGCNSGPSSPIFPQRYVGYGKVYESMTGVHLFYTGGRSASDLALTGREWQVAAYDGTTVNTHWTSNPLPTVAAASRFVFADYQETVFADGTLRHRDYTYDAHGNVSLMHETGIGGQTWTTTPYLQATSGAFVPQYELVTATDPSVGSPPALRRTDFYYDGNGSTPATPSIGRLTAKSTLVDAVLGETNNVYTAYDAAGQVTTQSVPTSIAPTPATGSGIPPGVDRTQTVYDPVYNTFPAKTVDAFGQQTTYANNDLRSAVILAQPVTVTEPNGHVTRTVYDAYGRPTKTWDNLDSSTAPSKAFVYSWPNATSALPNSTIVQERTQTGGPFTRSSVTCMDGFGRQIEQRQNYFGAYFSSVRTAYDYLGQKAVVTNAIPYGRGTACTARTGPSDVLAFDRTAFGYDVGHRLQTTTYAQANQATPACVTTGWPAGTFPRPCTQINTVGQRVTTIDENGHETVKSRSVDVAGVHETVQEMTGDNSNTAGHPWSIYATTTYTYDPIGQLTGVLDNAGNVTTIGYDVGGRKRSMDDPDMGHWTYTYDIAGNLKTQTDARNVSTTLAYAKMQRLTDKSYSDGTPAVHNDYDTDYLGNTLCPGGAGTPGSPGGTGTPGTVIGHLTRTTTAGVAVQSSCFDIRGRETLTRTTLTGDAANYDITRSYYPLGQVKDLTYPDGEVVRNEGGTYLWDGRIDGLTSRTNGEHLVQGAAPTAWGAPMSIPLGGGQTTFYTYDSRKRLTGINTGAAQKLALTYDQASNVQTVTDGVSGETATYGYDDLSRLSSMSLNGSAVGVYGYSTIGNLTTKIEAGPLTLCYPTGPAPVRPHAVTGTYDISGNCSTPTMLLYYDNNGNIAFSTTGYTSALYTYDAENRLKTRSVGAAQATYNYDGNGALVKRTNANGTFTEYIGGIFEKTFSAAGAATGTTKYYSAVGRTIAVRQTPASGASTLTYLLADHLGTTSARSTQRPAPSRRRSTGRTAHRAPGRSRRPTSCTPANSRSQATCSGCTSTTRGSIRPRRAGLCRRIRLHKTDTTATPTCATTRFGTTIRPATAFRTTTAHTVVASIRSRRRCKVRPRRKCKDRPCQAVRLNRRRAQTR